MSVTPEKSLSSFPISSHGPCYNIQFCHPRPTGQLPTNMLEKPRRLSSNRKYFYQTHVSKHESHTIYTTGDSCDDIVGGPTVRKVNDKNKTEFCKKIKCTRTNNSKSKDDPPFCAFWSLFSEYFKKMFQFYWGVITIRCPVRRNIRLCELSCEMRGVLFCMKRDFNDLLKNAVCLKDEGKKKEKKDKCEKKKEKKGKSDSKSKHGKKDACSEKDKRKEKEKKKAEKAEKAEKAKKAKKAEKAKKAKKDDKIKKCKSKTKKEDKGTLKNSSSCCPCA